MNSRFVLVLVLPLCVALPTAAVGETLTVRSLLDQKEKWPAWARDKTALTISGRYEGRAAKQFRLAKLPALLAPSRVTSLPKGIEAGQRVMISGILRKSGRRYTMDVSRIAVGRTDHERLAARIAKLGPDQPEQWYAVLDEYRPIAEFYKDEFLRKQIRRFKQEAFAGQRKQISEDPLRLMMLAELGISVGIAPTQLAAIRFESIVAMTKADKPDTDKILQTTRELLPGWDVQRVSIDPTVEKRFLANPVTEYEAANEWLRERLHRRFYRTVKAPQLLKGLKTDGSNGLNIANAFSAQLPEELEEIDRLQNVYIDYRLTRIPFLTRRQLSDLATLLIEFHRKDELKPSIQQWLKAQEKRLNNGQLDGILATAEEYLFAFERWKVPEHRDVAVELLKKGWTMADGVAPREAVAIGQRLEQFGWTRLRGKWMTSSQIANLPRNDVELAMREGRVVVGMRSPQIVGTLGQPGRKIRVISSRLVQEIWVYGDAGSSAITVHVQRGRRQAPEEAIATMVSKRAN